MQRKAEQHPPITGYARLRGPWGMSRRIRRGLQAVRRVPREDASPAARWVEDHARLLLDAADALARDLRFAPRLPAWQGTPRILALAREAVKEEELTAGLLVRRFREELGEDALTQAEIGLLPQAVACALFEELSDLLDTCIQEPDAYIQSRIWAAALAKGQKDHLPHDPLLLGRVLLRLDETEDAEALRRADELLAQAGLKSAEALGKAQEQWERDGLRAARVIAALRKSERLPYDRIAERLSPVAAALRQDAAYRRMDAESRDYYRRRACRIARRFHVSEGEAAQTAVKLAKNKPGVEGEAGYYLIEKPEMVGAALGKKASGFARKHRQGLVLLPLYAAAVLSLGLAIWLEAPWYAWPFIPLCASEILRIPYRFLLRKIFPARMTPRIQVHCLTPETRTLAVVPCLLASRKQAVRMARQLAVLRAANPDPYLDFMLLGDFADSAEETNPGDDEILLAARLSVEALNRQQGGGFLYLHRARTWDTGQGQYTGRERKRGALEALNRLIVAGESRDTFVYMSVSEKALYRRYAYVITLDADTFLPAGAAYRLVGAMLHPLQKGRVSVIQPRMAVSADSVRTRAQKLLGGAGGADPYCLAAQDVYQDAFGKGSFVGKGIYDPALWLKALNGRLPAGRLLSHDLIEGEIAGSALADDLALYDAHPAFLSGWRKRLHRWTRGDWQLLPFLWDTRLSWLSRHKIWDNLRRSLLPAAQAALLLAGAGLNRPVLFLLGLPWPLRGMGQRVLLLPGKAQTCLDAAARALWRQFVSNRNLLSWVTAAQAEEDNRLPFSCVLAQLAAGAGMLLSLRPAGFAAGALVGAGWMAGPLLVRFFDAPANRQRQMTDAQKENVRQLARSTWRFFEDTVSAQTLFLPPDNVQADPDRGPALRTSPTNVGLYLLSCCAARELRFITTAEMAKRLDETLRTLKKLETWKGHFYNWYDLRTGEALSPRFVSAVDSGNLSACLLCCAQICRSHLSELPEESAKLPARLDALARRADFKALYDERAGLFYIGWEAEKNRPTAAHYDTLASEARLTSYLAIMLGQVKRKHWARLNRSVTRAGGGPALLSWGGTMFEYLMPNLLLPLTPGTLLGESALNAVRAQMSENPQRPFGVSESGYAAFDPDMNYQYRAFGLPALARSPETAGQVIAPYASMLALPFFPRAAAENLERMRKLGWTDEHGLFEAADYTPQRIGPAPRLVKSHMAHHQGMILCAACNALQGDVLAKAFMTPPEAKAQSDLLLETAPGYVPRRREFPTPRQAEAPFGAFRRTARPGLPVDAHVLSGAGTSWVLTAQGQGTLTHDGMQAARFDPEAGAQTGPQFYVKDGSAGKFIRPAVTGNAVFEGGAVRYQAVWEGLQIALHCCVDPLTGAAVAALQVENPGPAERRVEAVSFLEIAQGYQADDTAHPNFRDLSVRVSPWGEHGMLSERLPRDEKDTMPVIGHIALGDGLVIRRQGDRGLFLGRLGTYAHPSQLLDENPPCRLGDVISPCCSLTVSLRVATHKKSAAYFVTAFAETKEKLEETVFSLPRAKAAFSLSATQSLMTARMLRLDGGALGLYQQILGALLFTGQPHQQAFPPAPQSALWRWGVSGNLPALLLRVEENGGQAVIRHALRCHAWLRTRGVPFDLLIFCPEEKEYVRPCRDRVMQCLLVSPDRDMLGISGGVHLASGTETEALALKTAARLTLRTGQSLREQLNALKLSLPEAEEKALSVPDPVPPGKLSEANGFGGYTHDGAYCVHAPAPVPWHLLLCGRRFGTLVCETGILSSFAENSRLGRITRQTPDVYRGVPSEEIYLLDEENRVWPLVRCAAVYEPGIAVYHGMAGNILCRTSVFSHAEKPLGVRAVTLRCEKEQRIRLYWAVRFALGERPEATRCLAGGGVVTAFGGDFPGAAFAGMEGGEAQALSPASCFGMKGEAVPLALLNAVQGVGNIALFRSDITLPPREPKRITLALGAAPSMESAKEAFGEILREGPADAARAVRGFWGGRLSRLLLFSFDDALCRTVNRWLPYQALASRLMGRTGPYQAGGAIGFRDQLQDCLALLYTEPAFVREHILLCAAHQYKEGDVQHWWHPPRRGVRTGISDDKLFLPYLTAKYIEAAGDESILEEEIPYLDSLPLSETEADRYEAPAVTSWTEPLLFHCMRAIDAVAFGDRGLPLMGAGDWNDGMNRVGGESVWLAFFLALVLQAFSPYCPADGKEKYRALRRSVLDSAESAWTGQWYLRAWYLGGAPLGGPDTAPPRVDLITQCFAVLGGAPKHHARAALAAAVEKLYDREAGIVKLLDPPFTPSENAGYIGAYLPGVRENGGQYTHAVPWLILALCRVGENALAWEIARAILPSNHTDTKEKALVYRAEPYVLCGDVYAGENRGRGGWSWYTGSAAWLYWVVVTELLGFEKRGDKARLHPVRDARLDSFTLIYRFGAANYHFTAAADCLFPTLDGVKSDDGWVTLVSDGKTHEARFPMR